MKDTAIYGVSSMLGRFINWALFPLYVNRLPSPSDYGIVTNLYAWTGLTLILLIYGMETGFFRFISKSDEPQKVYGNTLFCLAVSSSLFVLLGLLFLSPIATAMGYAAHQELVAMLIILVAIDAFVSIPFAYLRFTNRPILFASLRIGYILFMVLLNIFFLVVCPWIASQSWGVGILDFFRLDYGIGYIFISNLVANIVLLVCTIPWMRTAQWKIDLGLIGRMLAYSLPILLTGIAGNFNKMADKILMPMLYADRQEADHELGVYSAGFKIAIVIVMFSQAFRYAYEPFVFRSSNKIASEEKRHEMVTAMKYYIIFSLLILVGVMAYLDIIKQILPTSYYSGLVVVPIVMLSEMTFGVVFNHSLWYKLTDRTYWGIIISIIGCSLTVSLIVLGVPRFGFVACAWASVVSNFVMLAVSYMASWKVFPVRYDWQNALFYMLTAALCLVGIHYSETLVASLAIRLSINSVIVLTLLLIIIKKERIDQFLRKKKLT